ncbi:MAG: helix-turn-helix domain-containing protein [Prevotella sp.]|nr:helix-turn-helix domain-containing protein [Prevotella sp.]
MEEINVKELRESLKWSQEDLAEHLGVHWRTIQNWEAGGKISKTKYTKLCELRDGNPTIKINDGSPAITAKASGSGNNKASVKIGGSSDRIAALEKEIELLNQIIADKDKQIEFLKELLKK